MADFTWTTPFLYGSGRGTTATASGGDFYNWTVTGPAPGIIGGAYDQLRGVGSSLHLTSPVIWNSSISTPENQNFVGDFDLKLKSYSYAGDPTFVGSTNTLTSAVTNTTIGVPAGVQAGDLVMVFVRADRLSGPSGSTNVAAAGLTAVSGPAWTATSSSASVTVTFSTGGASVYNIRVSILVYRNAKYNGTAAFLVRGYPSSGLAGYPGSIQARSGVPVMMLVVGENDALSGPSPTLAGGTGLNQRESSAGFLAIDSSGTPIVPVFDGTEYLNYGTQGVAVAYVASTTFQVFYISPDYTLNETTHVLSVLPYVDFTWVPTSPTAGSLADFTATAEPIGSYSWNFGDSNTGTGQTPSHIYAAAGTYTVVLTFTVGSSFNTATHSVTVVGGGGGGGPPSGGTRTAEFTWTQGNIADGLYVPSPLIFPGLTVPTVATDLCAAYIPFITGDVLQMTFLATTGLGITIDTQMILGGASTDVLTIGVDNDGPVTFRWLHGLVLGSAASFFFRASRSGSTARVSFTSLAIGDSTVFPGATSGGVVLLRYA